jgi:hypothetical protein
MLALNPKDRVMTHRTLVRALTGLAASVTLLVAAAPVLAQNAKAIDARAARVIEHWTPERRAAATPRDLLIDERGLGYLRTAEGLEPYGHGVSAQAGPSPAADTVGPTITGMTPANNATIGAAFTFTATVTDSSGVKSVTFKIRKGTGRDQSFTANAGANGLYSVSLSGFTDGAWSWYVVAKDTIKGGNTTTSPVLNFTVNTSGGGGGGGGGTTGAVPNAEWTGGGVVQNAVGRIYFEMPANVSRTRWDGYVCSGTVVNDGTPDRSLILTASHCVYDDANKAFARNVLFIPNQDQTSGSGTDLNCANDPMGCWAPYFGVVDTNWTTRTFPNNVAWDYAFYVVNDVGAHSGTATSTNVLDVAVTAMGISFSSPTLGTLTHGLGYSYSVDPQFMYCADGLTQESTVNWWLGNCGLTGGSSGGPWSQPFNTSTGNGPIISVNSWGYTGQPGMAGPKLAGTSASCVFAVAKSSSVTTTTDGEEGVKANCQ